MKCNISTWVCATCSQGFTRKSGANKHNSNIHNGTGVIVRFFEYIVGRLEGKYAASDPLLFRKNNGKNFRNHSDTAVASERMPSNTSYGDSIACNQSHDVSLNHRPPTQVKDGRHDFSDLDYTIDLVSRVQKIRNLLPIQEASGSTYAGITHSPWNKTYGTDVNALLVQQFDIDYFFGYEGKVCPVCARPEIYRLDFRDGNNQKRIWSTNHECDPQALASYEKEKESRGTKGIIACDSMPLYLLPLVERWLKNNLNIFAIKLPDLSDIRKGLIDITNPINPSESICIPFYNEDVIIMSTGNREYWVARAVANENKPTPLHGEEELLNFLLKVGHSTFGVFNVCSRNLYRVGYRSEYYLIYLGKGAATVQVYTDTGKSVCF